MSNLGNYSTDLMAKQHIEALTETDALISERNELLQLVVRSKIDILVLERSEPGLQVATRNGPIDPRTGQPMSKIAITAKEMLGSKQKDLDGHLMRLKAIDSLFKV